MPQATDEARQLMNSWFHNGGISDKEPWDFLFARGWTDRMGMITPPVQAYNPSLYEYACIEFLCAEWDYGYKGRELI